MSQSSPIPHYKTLDIIKFYNQVYEFVSRYLIFVFAGVLSVISILVIWIREPDISNAAFSPVDAGSGNFESFVQESGLIYPINYFAGKLISFDGDNKIYGLGGPIWSTQQLTGGKLWNSIDNIVQYNGVILPRQISRSAWVPQFTQQWYTDTMVKTFLDGMGTSVADIDSIQSSLSKKEKSQPPEDIINLYNIGCTQRKLFTTRFCDLKLYDALSSWGQYDLSSMGNQLNIIYEYIFNYSQHTDNQELFCTSMLKQYRYSGSAAIARVIQGCSAEINNEVAYIGHMIAINQEVTTNKFTNKVYDNDSINQYKLMSWYQYLMSKVQGGEYIDDRDDEILRTYGSYITKLADSNTIIQPYGDIVSVFHQAYLIPWLEERDSYASLQQKDIANQLISISNLIINGDESQGIVPVTSGSRMSSNGVDYNTPIPEQAQNPDTINTSDDNTDPSQSIDNTSLTPLETLISQVLGTKPESVIKKGDTVIVSYASLGASWFAAIDMNNNGETTIFYDSPDSGATKITHEQVIFTKTSQELIRTIMYNYLNILK